MVNAIHLARQRNPKVNVALFQDVMIEHPDLPGIGYISGAVDYLSSATGQNLPVKDFGDTAIPQRPHFVVVEAKRAVTIGETAIFAQLYAQMLTLHYMDK
jgi:hypothetical protein